MSGIIHMEIGKVALQSRNLTAACGDMETLLEKVFAQVMAMQWEGGASVEFRLDAKSLHSRFQAALQDGEALALRMQKELEEWVDTDQRGAVNYAGLAPLPITPINIMKGSAGYVYFLGFTLGWATLSVEEKLKYLQDEMEKIAKKLGIPVVPIILKDLEDSENMDRRGYFDSQSGALTLDLRDLENGEYPGSIIVSTLAHETRHAYQHYCVQYLETNGVPPDGLSLEQVTLWRDNYANYIEPGDYFEGYQKQPIESDARAWEDQYLQEKFMGATLDLE